MRVVRRPKASATALGGSNCQRNVPADQADDFGQTSMELVQSDRRSECSHPAVFTRRFVVVFFVDTFWTLDRRSQSAVL